MSNKNMKKTRKVNPKNSKKVGPTEKKECRGGSSLAIGIDLGTTYSCAGVWQHGRVKIITDEQGNRTTPSCVAFTKVEHHIGCAAKNQFASNPANTIYDAKRLIGAKFDDATVQDDMKRWPFKVIADPDTKSDKKPMIVVTHKGEEKCFSAVEISSMVLMKMKQTAETCFGSPVQDAVITVPAYFDDSQRRATEDAGVIAGLNVIHIVDEPIAAAIAYGFDKNLNSQSSGNRLIHSNLAKNVLIFDLGGGTFDVTLLTKEKKFIQVKAANGDTHLGGRDFDNKLIDHIVEEFKKKHGKDITQSSKSLARLRASCEKAKRMLSSITATSIEIDCLFEDIDFSGTITRAHFEELNKDLFKRCMGCVEKCLTDGKIERGDIDNVVLVGGSTRIPKVREMLLELFSEKELLEAIDPDEAVAYGATIISAAMSSCPDNLNSMFAGGVTASSLGLKVYSGDMSVVVPKNTTVPAITEKNIYTTAFDKHTKVWFQVYEGVEPIADRNNFLGQFELNDVPPAPKGVPKFDVCFDIDADGVLTVTAKLRGTSNRKQIRIANTSRTQQQKIDIEKVIEAATNKAEQEQRMQAIKARKANGVLSKMLRGIRKTLKYML